MSHTSQPSPALFPRPAAARGFTLVELLASIGIIIFILSLAILAVGPALRSAGTKDAARRFRAGLDSARVQAIQQRRAVRFEARRVKESPEQWAVAPNAGAPQFEWYHLPEFVAVRTNAGSTTFDTAIESLTITFGPAATVKAITVDDNPVSDPTGQFRIRFHTMREAPDDEVNKTTCFIEVTPLTGVIRSYGYDTAIDEGREDELPKKQP